MAEMFSLAAVATGPALSGLAALINAVKAPLGKRRFEDLRVELQDGLENVKAVFEQQSTDIQNLQDSVALLKNQNGLLAAQVVFLRLPFWKRWSTPFPSSPLTNQQL